ncbi:MAG: radical SAM family heme chaperone HemW [Alphaproteobacteria bacterium]
MRTAIAPQLEPTTPGFGLYIHWPFCRAKCPYCDFNSHVRDDVNERRFRDALLTELDHFASVTPRRTLTSIFFGGGTPSLMSEETVGSLIAGAAKHWRLPPDIEITLEANPNSAEAGRFEGYRNAGVNRLSIGVQALDDRALAFLGRLHGADEAFRALETAAKIFPRFSFDLIYARPEQSLDAWRAELSRALALGSDHLSLYQLTLEEGTSFYTRAARGEFAIPDPDQAATFYEITQEMTEAAGVPAYEISNHARPGQESRHNLVYWRYQDYVGVGPGAHGRLTTPLATKTAFRQERAPETWLAAVTRAGHATCEIVELSPSERIAEMLMMGLRLREGISEQAFRDESGSTFAEVLDRRALDDLIAGEFLDYDVIQADRGTLRATAAGRLVLNAVLAKLLA